MRQNSAHAYSVHNSDKYDNG